MNAIETGLAPAAAPAAEHDDEDDDGHPFPAFVGLKNAILLMGGAAVVVVGLVALARGCAS